MTTTTSANTTFPRHEKSHLNGGIQLKDDPDSNINTRSVIINIVKGVGSKLKEGKVMDLLKVSRPAMISYHRTYLECVAKYYIPLKIKHAKVLSDLINTHFLDEAAAARTPVKRMKCLIAFLISGLHRNACEMGNNGPLNPVLGETYIAEKSDGTKLYCEQVTHHPPVSAYYMVDAKKNYKLSGTGEVSARLSGLNCIEGKRIGQTVVQFKDGGKVTIGNPEMIIEGVMMGDRIINHVRSFYFVDAENEVTAEVKFTYNPVGTVAKVTSGFKSLFGYGSSQGGKVLNDTFSVNIYSTENGNKRDLSTGSGSWLSYLEMDGEVLWTVKDEVQTKWAEEVKGRLESDSSKRLDSQFIRIKDFDKAQKEKELLENTQRADAKLRKAASGKDTKTH